MLLNQCQYCVNLVGSKVPIASIQLLNLSFVIFAAPTVPTGPKQYYMNLEIINQAGIPVNITYKGEQETMVLPTGGVGLVKYSIITVVTPDSLVYKIHEKQAHELLLLNGKHEISVTPTLTPMSPFRIVINKGGMYALVLLLGE